VSLPRWTPADEVNLRRRVRRILGDRVEPPPATARSKASPGGTPWGCRSCQMGGHRHAAFRVGPFVICRCLSCPVLVVAP
jgi:hypothetical protein